MRPDEPMTAIARLGFWILGVVAGGILAFVIRPSALAGNEPFTFTASVLLIGLFGELVFAARALDLPRTEGPPPGARAADGTVELATMAGVERVPNQEDPRFFAFQGLDASHPRAEHPVLHARTPPPLLGRVAIISVFVGWDGRPWSDLETARAQSAVLRAGAWIEREAMRWRAPVNVAVADTYFVAMDQGAHDEIEMTFVTEGEGAGPLEAKAVTKALIDLSRAAAQLGFRDAQDWVSQINGRVRADAHVWLLHPRRAGRSIAVPLDLTELSGVSLAVCYAREASFPEPLIGPPLTDSATIVHELLHLFGARDKYGVALRSFPADSVSARDIMRLGESRLARLRVDPRTAAEIGWVAPA